MSEAAKGPIQILLAEDDDNDYLIFVNALEQTSHTFTIGRVENGEALMSVLADTIPDILFLDVQMPCKDGRQCIGEIRESSRYDKLPVIALNDSSTIDHFYQARSNFLR